MHLVFLATLILEETIIRINKTTDYAIRIVLYLAQQKRIVSSTEMVNVINISQRYILEVAKKLNENGYIDVVKGMNGGYSLSKPPEEISMYDVFILMEGPLLFLPFLRKDNPCEEISGTLHDWYNFFQRVIECYLRSLTIDSFIMMPIDTWRTRIIDDLNDLLSQQKEMYRIFTAR